LGPDCFLNFILGTRLLSCFIFKDLIAFYVCMAWLKSHRLPNKVSVASSLNTCGLTNTPPKSQTSLYKVRYLKWESKSEVAQATKHTLRGPQPP
jgi:hypothetical protein